MTAKNFAIVITVLALIVPAFADAALPANDESPYIFKDVGDNVVRLNTRTGEVAVCTQRTVGWACQIAPEDRAVLEGEIARLRSENAALEEDILARGLPLPRGIMPEPSDSGGSGVILRLPDDGDVDRAVAYVGRVWHRLVEAIAKAEHHMLNKS